MRPFSLILPAIVTLAVAKSAMIYLESSERDADSTRSAFVSAAVAATDQSAEQAPAEETAEAQTCEAPEELLASIRRERELLQDQKDRGAKRAAENELAAESLEIEHQRLADLKSELEALMARIEAAHTADVDRLVKLYRNMKPKDAATIMNDLDLEVSVMVLGTMDERDAAPILAALDPIRARAISQIILERSKLPGDQRLDDIRL